MSEGTKGARRLARVLDARIKEHGGTPPLDFGTIGRNAALTADTYPVPIPEGDYCICCTPVFRAGDRVLVAWVGSEAVVVDKIAGSDEMRGGGA